MATTPKAAPQPSEATAEKSANDNLYIWRMGEETDPRHTKPVSLGRKLTAIDSYYTIKKATEVFGPFGLGWGYVAEDDVLLLGSTPMAKIRMILWYMDPDTGERIQCGPVIAMNKLMSDGGKPDEEAFKKATTDALTKSLSYLGFSADVFMGLFDDNRYVEQLNKKFQKKEQEQRDQLRIPEALAKAIEELKACKTQDDFKAIKERVRPEFERLTDKASTRYVALQFRTKELELWPEMADDEGRKQDAAA